MKPCRSPFCKCVEGTCAIPGCFDARSAAGASPRGRAGGQDAPENTETGNAFDVLLSCVHVYARKLDADAPLDRQTRASAAVLLRSLGTVLVELEGMLAKVRAL